MLYENQTIDRFLRDENYNGQYNEMLYKWLKDQGVQGQGLDVLFDTWSKQVYTGNFTERQKAFYNSVKIEAPEVAFRPSAGAIDEEKASLEDFSSFTTTGTVTAANGQATLGESSRITTPLSLGAGEWWAHTITDSSSSGTYRPRMLSPTYAPEATRNRYNSQVWKLPDAELSTSFDVVTGTGASLIVDYLQMHDMSTVLSQPADIWLLMGQSNMAASTTSLPVDKYKDSWPDTRLLYLPGSTYAVEGAVAGELTGAKAPLVMDAVTNGVSPGMSFGKYVIKRTRPDRNVILVAAAVSGTSLEGPTAAWNPTGEASAYNAAVSLTNSVQALAPVGSVVRGVLWAQGEGDTSADMSSYPTSFATMRASFESATSIGQVPWIIILGPPDATRLNQDEFIRVQRAMDADSKQPESQPLVYSVNRPAGYMEDSTHVNAAGQRLAGKEAGKRALELGLIQE